MFSNDIDNFSTTDTTSFALLSKKWFVYYKETKGGTPYIFVEYTRPFPTDKVMRYIIVPLVWDAFDLADIVESNFPLDNPPRIDFDTPVECYEYLFDGTAVRHYDGLIPTPWYVKKNYETKELKLWDNGHSPRQRANVYPLDNNSWGAYLN